MHLLEWKGFVNKSVTGTRTLKTSIMWSSNQLSLILHSSAVRSCQRFLRGFLFWMPAARLLPTFYTKMSLYHPPLQYEHVVFHKQALINSSAQEGTFIICHQHHRKWVLEEYVFLWWAVPGPRMNQVNIAAVTFRWNMPKLWPRLGLGFENTLKEGLSKEN